MARDTLTGSRIRERRVMAGIKQAELARRVDISASYLNLIEHNRRKIGGRLLLDIAQILDVEPSALTEGAEAALIAQLREAALSVAQVEAETRKADEFAGRFPGWAQVLAETYRRVATLERTVVSLTDRLAHDPHLADSLHDMLTTVTAIHSTASILTDATDIEPEWQDRFHRNINEDSARLAEVSQTLVRYLDNAGDASADIQSPQEEIDSVLARHSYSFAALEAHEPAAASPSPHALARSVGAGLSAPAQELLQQTLTTYATDAAALPRDVVVADLKRHGLDPFARARDWECPPDRAMRRIAALAGGAGLGDVALVRCDMSGALTYRQPTDDFPLPRFGAGCGRLPLYQALWTPFVPVAQRVTSATNTPTLHLAYAYGAPTQILQPGQPAILAATMLAVAQRDPAQTRKEPHTGAAPIPIGVACRVCPREACPARREPSILSGGL
ncbi:MAG: short-chain fatty acyl-CoA regulator family protein [Paracoccaceae bacterium]